MTGVGEQPTRTYHTPQADETKPTATRCTRKKIGNKLSLTNPFRQ